MPGNTSDLQNEKMQDRAALCKCFADSNYPYLFNRYKSRQTEIYWIKLFMFIPCLKIVKKRFIQKYYLFGVIPLISKNLLS